LSTWHLILVPQATERPKPAPVAYLAFPLRDKGRNALLPPLEPENLQQQRP